MIAEQLTLGGFVLRDDATFDNFFTAENSQVLHSIDDLLQANGENFIYLWGAEGSGRSHLLQAICHKAAQYKRTALYLPLDQYAYLSPDSMQGLENINIVCLDDIDRIATDAKLEEAAFHLYNRMRANNNCLVVTASTPPSQINIQLPDLKSRLAWGIVYQVHALNDDQKISALQLRAQARGLDLDENVGRFLLRRCPRNMTQLFNTLQQLDQASLAHQRRLTIPFVKEVLGV